ncbi:MAG TPA: hypothetical protein VMW41_03190 [Candidatus Bathyarchaeia archaeon]|nr:hypothetical protein [Candidatus Bathyarchaeia archaeon]
MVERDNGETEAVVGRRVRLAEDIFWAWAQSDLYGETVYLTLTDGQRLALDIEYGLWEDILDDVLDWEREEDDEDEWKTLAEREGIEAKLHELGLNKDFYFFFIISDPTREEGEVGHCFGIYSDRQTVGVLKRLEKKYDYCFGIDKVIPRDIVDAFWQALASAD